MASKVKKLSVMKIRKICVSRKALREEAVLERVSGELAGISKVYLDSCNGEFESMLQHSVHVRNKKVKWEICWFVEWKDLIFSGQIRSASSQVLWIWEVSKSEEARKLVHDSSKEGDIVRSMVSCYIWK